MNSENGLIEKYLEERRLNGTKASTLKGMRKTLLRLDKFKPLNDCTADDVKAFLGSGDANKNTTAIYKSYIKQFYLWHNRPEVVSWMKIRIIKPKLDESKLLTGDEIKSMLEFSQHPRDKVLVALLAETGMRIQELLSLSIGDIRDTDYGMTIRIPDEEGNKTGSRCIPIIDSVPYLKSWLNIYPKAVSGDKGDKGDKKKNEKPFLITFNKRNQYERLSYNGAYKIIRNIARDAGIERDGRVVHPHLFRHTALTEMVKQGYNESIIRKKAGWTSDSKMVATYLHATDKDVETAMLAKQGLRHIQQVTPQIQLTKECPTCHKQIPVDAQYCENCSKHQDLSPMVKKLLEEHQQILFEFNAIKEAFGIRRLPNGNFVFEAKLRELPDEVQKKHGKMFAVVTTEELDSSP